MPVLDEQGAGRLDSLFLGLKDASCTDRCHVNSLSYRNDFEGEVFQHATHPPTRGWGLHCADCHEDKEVNREGHGRLTIGKKECLDCHHVDNRNENCARCHKDIDTRPMEYKGEHFVHGFNVKSDINCKECHLIDPKSSMKEGINCNKCHHTGPRMACTGCHEKSLTKVYYPRPADMNYLGWTAGFLHSQHPEAKLSCRECHPPREDRAKGVGEYQAHCGQCHHKKKPALHRPFAPLQGGSGAGPALDPESALGGEGEGADCQKCHQVVFQFFNGEPPVGGIKPLPDKMSRVVKCEDCHKLLEGGGGFSGVGEECARCHNKHYAELLEAQRGVVLSWVDRLRKTPHPSPPRQREGGSISSDMELLDFLEQYGLHNFLYSKGALSLLEKDSKTTVKE
ncbi:MAG: hypothetical protein HZA70_05675 [Planctomycetes bacterium]|nr:hypothetical protein [Planctomycetota bacterium]